MTYEEIAADALTAPPQYRVQHIADELMRAEVAGFEKAREWHRRQAALMKRIIEHCETGCIGDDLRSRAEANLRHHESSASLLTRS